MTAVGVLVLCSALARHKAVCCGGGGFDPLFAGGLHASSKRALRVSAALRERRSGYALCRELPLPVLLCGASAGGARHDKQLERPGL